MHVQEFFLILGINCAVIFLLHLMQKRAIEQRLKHLKKDVQDLEDLVAAIIEEFEEVAELTTSNKQTEPLLTPGLDEQHISEPLHSLDPAVVPLTEIKNEQDEETELVTTDTSITDPTLYFDDLIKAEQPECICPPDPPVVKTPVFRDPKQRQILELWQQGVAIEEIARQLGTGRGEIQLILGIYKRS